MYNDIHNCCKEWKNDVEDPRKINQVFKLPIATVAGVSENIMRPLKEENAPDLFYPQKGEETCGVSALSSAFAYMFDKNVAAKIYSNKYDYIKSLSEPVSKKSKMALSRKFLSRLIVETKEFKNYYV